MNNLVSVRVALLGDSATQFLAQELVEKGRDKGIDLQLWEAEFNQVERQIFDPTSELYAFDPQLVILFQTSHKLLGKYNKLAPEEYKDLADNRLKLVDQLSAAINAATKAKIIYYNYPEIDDAVFGNFSAKTESSFLFQLRKLNYELMVYAVGHPAFYSYDLSALQNRVGRQTMFRPSLYVNTEMVLSVDVLPEVAAGTVSLIGALVGQAKKCLILDLDNTLWGGVIGDDGLDHIEIGSLGIGKAFTELQYWIKKLKERGIILAVCSKNTDVIAREPFERHPDMVLRLEDIAVFQASWDNKVENIRKIQALLNIGLDSMVFLDDNPFERNMVRDGIPEITVPELPEDPADWLEYLYGLNLFETVSLSTEDGKRAELYQTQARREEERQQYENEADFLAGLNMISRVEPFNSFNTPRIAQLSQRSNQFNLRTVRYTESDILSLSGAPDVFTFSFDLEDRFGNNGIICVAILKKETEDILFIDTWLMSCRVLKRGMEEFTLNTIAGFARQQGFRTLKGEYLQTPKNELVKNHYRDLGFVQWDGCWLLDTFNFEPRETWIKKKY